MKSALQASMDAGAAGIKVEVSGRIGGAEIARSEWYKDGSMPLHTLRADIDFAHGRAETTYGSIGVKVWINRGAEQLTANGGLNMALMPKRTKYPKVHERTNGRPQQRR